MFCPNYKIKEVFDSFNEMVEALGGKPMTEEEFRSSELRNQRTGQNYSAMESAYKMYHRNNGNMPDTAPNGKHSILFDSLLELFNGDRKAAIEAKSKVYSTNFLNWFGDWINDPANASKVVDENGEPLLVYHTGKKDIEVFLTEVLDDEGLPTGIPNAIYTTDDKYMSLSYQLTDELAAGYDMYIDSQAEHILESNSIARELAYDLVMDYFNHKLYGPFAEEDKAKILKFIAEHRKDYPDATKTDIALAFADEMFLPKTTDELLKVPDAGHQYALFVSIKNPKIIDAKNKSWNEIEDNGVVKSTRDLEDEYRLSKHDGVIITSVMDYGNNITYSAGIPNTVQISYLANQIKSAVGNNEKFSTTNDNIYQNKNQNGLFDLLNWIYKNIRLKNGISNKLLLSHAYGQYFLPQEVSEEELESFRISKLLPKGIFNIRETPNALAVTINNDVLVDTIERNEKNTSLEDLFETDEEAKNVRTILDFLSSKTGLKYVTITEDEAKEILKSKDVSGVNAFVQEGTAYFIQGRKLNVDIAAEEMLHPFVESIHLLNTAAFNSLLADAKKAFPKLRLEIAKTYAGLSIKEELVTLALARAFRKDIENNPEGNSVKDLVKHFIDYVISVLTSSFGQGGRIKNYFTRVLEIIQQNRISARDLQNSLKIEDLAKIINSSLELENANITRKIAFNKEEAESNESITRQMYDAAEQIENEREAFVKRLIDQYKHNFPNAEQKDISRVANNSRNQFNEEQANKLMYQHLQLIAESFGLSINSKGFYESSEEGLKKLMLEYFVNSMQEDTFNLYSLEDLGKDKYQQAGRVQNVGSVDSAIYHAIYDGNLRTLDKVLARDYIRMFWKSDLIQASLKVLDTGNKTSLELEDALVDNITREEPSERDTKITKWFKDFWDRLSRLIKSVFDGEELSEGQKNRILKAVDAAYMLSQDLKQTREEKGILDRAEGDMSSSQYLSARDKLVFQSIKQGIKTRFKSHVSRNVKDENFISDLKLRLEIIDQRDEDSVDDVFNTVQDFLVKATMEIGKAEYEIDDKILSKDISEWDPQEINFILYDLLGYYENMLAVVSDLFSDPMSSVTKFNAIRLNLDPNAVDLKNTLRQALNDLNMLKETYQRRVVMKYVKHVITDFVNRSETIKDKPTFIYNTIKQLEQDAAYGDISASEVIIGMASRSGSGVVRILEKMVSSTEFLTHRHALKKANELMLKYKEVLPFGLAIDPRNWQKRFMEFDDKGIPTGYFIRDINYGQFYRNKDAKEQELRIKYNLQADEDGDTIFPEEDYTANNSTYNRYYDELDKWLDENCNRRYTLEYYKLKRRFLSPDTIKALNKIQRRIDLLLDSVRTKGGYINKSKLTPNQKLQLDKFRKEKRDLGIAYVITETADGVLRFERKTGAGERMADEISAWNAYVRDKIKYKPNLDKFEKAKQELKDSGATEEELNAFELSNTSLRITEDFYNLLFDVVGKSATTPELEKLKRRHSQILSVLKERQGAGSQKLSKLGFGLNTDISGWKELQYLEQRMADIRKDLRSKGVHGESPKNSSLSFGQIASMMPVALSDTEKDKTFLTYLINKWKDVIINKNEMQTVFDNLFRYKDEKGVYRYLKAFDYLTPKDYTLTVDGRTIKCLERLPISEYSELDKVNSSWVNDDFVDDGPSMLPKEMYKNAAYLDLTEKEHEFLDLLVSTMEEANSMIPKKAKNRDYLLPQMSGRTTSVMSNMIQTKNLLDAAKYPFRDFSNSYAETDSDASTNADLPRRPDGSVVNNIPVRFVDRLKDPKAQSTDVLGSVIIFYEMALNYANKSKNLPTLELIKYATRPEMSNTFRAENQYKKIENILDQRYYGKETTFGFNSNEKITPGKQRTIQITKTVRNMASIAMLGINMFTIGVGFADASISVLADTIGGKYLTGSDLRFALSEMTRNLPAALAALGSASSDNKALAAMRYNKLSTSNAELFGNSDMSRVTRLFKKYLLMGGYTLSDYTINSLILYATYHHYRLVTDPRGKRKFCSKTDAINMFTKYGYSEPEAISMWENSEKTLWDAYTCEKGEFKVLDEYKDVVTSDLEDNIAGRVEDRTAVYNGVVPLSQKAKLQQNVFGSYLTLMRGFYINSYWERFHSGADRVKPEEQDHEVHWYSGFTKDNAGRENLETGEFDGALFVDFCRGVYKLASNLKNILRGTEKNKLTSNQWYAVRRCSFELAMIGFLVWQMLWSVFFARVNNYDDDKDPAWIINLTGPDKGIHINTNNIGEKFADYQRWAFALFSTRLFTERIGMWYPGTFFDIITSVSSAESFLDDVGSIFSLTVDLFSQRSDEEVLRGGYSHMTRGTRDILKLLAPLGLDNIVRQGHTEGVKATLNYYKGLAPTKYIVPSLAEFNESQGLNSHGAKPKKRHNSNSGEFAD